MRASRLRQLDADTLAAAVDDGEAGRGGDFMVGGKKKGGGGGVAAAAAGGAGGSSSKKPRGQVRFAARCFLFPSIPALLTMRGNCLPCHS